MATAPVVGSDGKNKRISQSGTEVERYGAKGPGIDIQRILAGLTPEQRAAAMSNGATLVLAGAGTGKTRALTSAVIRRIAEGTPSWRIMAVTFTNKAANEMKERIASMLGEEAAPSWVGTFHSLSARLLRQFPEAAGLRRNFDVLDTDDARRVLRRALKAADQDTERERLDWLTTAIERMKDNLTTPEEAAAAAKGMAEPHVIERLKWLVPGGESYLSEAAEAYGLYQQRLREGNGADFADLLLWPTLAMQKSEAVRLRWASMFDVVLADEYQDVNNVQYQFLKLLARDHRQILVVGDDDQSIYRFRGADVAHIRSFSKDFPEATTIRLEENFRSTGHILEAANAVIACDPHRLGKTLYTEAEPGLPVEIVEARNGEEEADLMVREMARRNAQGVSWGDMAILYRSNVLSRPFEDALRRYRIPHVVIGDVGFWQRQEVKDGLALLKLALMPTDRQSDESFRRVANVPARGLGAKALEKVEARAAETGFSLLAACTDAGLSKKAAASMAEFAAALRWAGEGERRLSEICFDAIERTGYVDHWRNSRADGAKGRVQNLADLVNEVGTFNSVEELFEHAALAGREKAGDEASSVRLMTIHRAKGLEFPHVFLPAWEHDVFPSPMAIDEGNLDEERRLAYVALTRARIQATVSYAAFRVGRGYTGASRFVMDIPQEHSVRRYGTSRPTPAWDDAEFNQDVSLNWSPARALPRF